MSLLMDALKKAEEAKRLAETAAPGKADTPSLAPGASAGDDPNDQRGLPELPTRLELLDAEFHTANTPQVAPSRAKPSVETTQQQAIERAAAQNLFTAKQPESRSAFPIVIGAVTLIALIGIGVYFWLQLQPAGGLSTKPVALDTHQSPSAATLNPAQPALQPALLPASQPDFQPTAQTASPSGAPVARSMSEHAVTSAARLTREPPIAPASPIRFTTSHLKVNPTVAQAYQAFSAGDLIAARREYEQLLKSEPKNSDALHGLAAISLREGQPIAAEDYYLRALEADPKDATAQAALLGLRGQVDPVQSESRLKTLLAGQPESAALNFSLGNLYARQNRWNEAQQAYFRAYTADAENPDYLFNLAVSLEQIRQPKLALQYYQSALAAAAQRPAAFDKAQVAGRVRELQQ